MIKEYSDRLLGIVNNVRLLGTEFSDARIVQKILVTIPEKFEATIASLENSRNLSSITLAELLNALQAQEQRRLMRQEGSVEGVFQARSQNYKGGKNNKKKQSNNKNGQSSKTRVFSPCPYFSCNRDKEKRHMYHCFGCICYLCSSWLEMLSLQILLASKASFVLVLVVHSKILPE